MSDLLVMMVFLGMALSPCFVALWTGVHVGADLGRRDPTEIRYPDADQVYIPGRS